jgi:CubicO group peptidase (beta-lactamase class C family)
MKPIITLLITLLFTVTVYSQQLENRLDSLLQGHVEKGELHGGLAYVYQKGKVVLFKTYGYMDVENKRQVEKDAIFRIASMTKILTAAAALKLYEEGKFLLDEPVKNYIPEFANLRVIAPECTNIDSVSTIPLERDVTIRDLFRHTAGFGYGGNDIVGQLYVKKIIYSDSMTIKQFVQAITTVPLKFQPGSKWEYSFANDILGYLVEVVSGKPLDEYMDEAIFKPMNMENTGFYVKSGKLNKLCNFYEYSNNSLKLIEVSTNSKLVKRPAFISGGAGGVSTIDDYSKFCQMLLNYGKYNGKQILSRQTVELITTNQIGEITDRGFPVDGFSFGIGVTPGKYCGRAERCSWSGSPFNTTFTIDYKNQAISILFVQNAPWGHLGLIEKFSEIVSEETNEQKLW